MKLTLLLSLLFSFSYCTSLWAETSPENRGTLLCLRNQLTSQNWQSDAGSVWQFNPDGTILHFQATQQQFSYGYWTLESTANQLALRIDLGNGDAYWASATDCNMASLQLATSLTESVEIHALASKSTNMDWIIGDWQLNVYSNHPIFTFNTNGTYQRLSQTAKEVQITTGNWMLSRDGNSLLLYRHDGELDVFALKHLNLDELVIQAYQPGATDVYLNKL